MRYVFHKCLPIVQSRDEVIVFIGHLCAISTDMLSAKQVAKVEHNFKNEILVKAEMHK